MCLIQDSVKRIEGIVWLQFGESANKNVDQSVFGSIPTGKSFLANKPGGAFRVQHKRNKSQGHFQQVDLHRLLQVNRFFW